MAMTEAIIHRLFVYWSIEHLPWRGAGVSRRPVRYGNHEVTAQSISKMGGQPCIVPWTSVCR
jgi:hypothetical protein